MDDPILEYRILKAVHQDDGALTQKDISTRIGRSVSSVNFGLRLLAVKGYIKISGANPKRLRYHVTPQGVVRKAMLAYSFLKTQVGLYEEVRNGLLNRLDQLRRDAVSSVAIYGWTPFTESAILYLISEGIHVSALYVECPGEMEQCNRIPVKPIAYYGDENDCLVLMEPLPADYETTVSTRRLVCYPEE